jgi:hypothetical protein
VQNPSDTSIYEDFLRNFQKDSAFAQEASKIQKLAPAALKGGQQSENLILWLLKNMKGK